FSVLKLNSNKNFQFYLSIAFKSPIYKALR
ncbi:MAG: hypothetical protein ACI9IZ_000345, partial [Nonlabens sp.]